MIKRVIVCILSLLLALSPCLSISASASRGEFLDQGPVIEDYDFAMVFIPDAQVITCWHTDSLHYIFDWIINNAESKKIEFVVGLGDLTERSSYVEWWEVEKQVDRLNGVVPYALVRGNHDKTLDFNKFFPKNETPYIDGTYDVWINNSWRTVRMGGYDYLIITLDYGADDDMLSWASGVIEDHPNHNVIIATHSYLCEDGTTLDADDDCPPSLSGGTNDGNDMWEKLFRKHENITLVLSGHDHSDRIVYRQDQGDHGNTVTQMLIDSQNLDLDTEGGAGMIAIAYFSDGGRQVQIEYYSAIRNQWFREDNQFTLELDVVEPADPPWAEPPIDWLSVNIAVVTGICVILIIMTIIIKALKKRKEKV